MIQLRGRRARCQRIKSTSGQHDAVVFRGNCRTLAAAAPFRNLTPSSLRVRDSDPATTVTVTLQDRRHEPAPPARCLIDHYCPGSHWHRDMCAGPGLSLKGAPGRSQWHEKHTVALRLGLRLPVCRSGSGRRCFWRSLMAVSLSTPQRRRPALARRPPCARPVRAGAASGHRDSTAIMITP